MSINKGNIGNALHSVAPDHVVVTADDIYDETLNKYQSELNQQIGQGGGGGVTGVKGSSESSYRTGNVEITKANIGLGNVGNFKAVSTVSGQGLSSSEKENSRTNIDAASSTEFTSHKNNTTIHILSSERDTWNEKGTYSKPEGGIPVADLSETVRDAVEKNPYTKSEVDGKIDLLRSELNAKQLEIGAVQTDSTPQKNSSKFVNSGGTYDGIKNDRKEIVTRDCRTDFVIHDIIVEALDHVVGKWRLWSSGAENTNADYQYKVMKVRPLTSYIFPTNDNYNVCYYDAKGEYVSGVSANRQTVITTPTGIYYMVVSYKLTDDVKIYEGSHDGGVSKLLDTPTLKESVKIGFGSTENVLEVGKNKFDSKHTIEGIYFNAQVNGVVATNENWCASYLYIPIKSSTTYYRNLESHICFYDKDLNFISGVYGSSSSFTTPSNAKYLRASVNKLFAPRFMITEEAMGSYVYTPFESIPTKATSYYCFNSSSTDVSSVVKKLIKDIYLIRNSKELESGDSDSSLFFAKPFYFVGVNSNGFSNRVFGLQTGWYGNSTYNRCSFVTPSSYNKVDRIVKLEMLNYSNSGNLIDKYYDVYVEFNDLTELDASWLYSDSQMNAGMLVRSQTMITYLLGKANGANGYYVVSKDGKGDFMSVTDASSAAPADSVILIMPGVYDNEVVTGCSTKKQHFVGIDKAHTIIKNSIGNYNSCPMLIGAGSIKGLTIYAEKTTVEATKPPYAIHSECHTLYNDKLLIEDCDIISDYDAGIGIGMRGGCVVEIKNCTLKGYNRGIYCHDSDYMQYNGRQQLSLKNNLIVGTNSNYAIWIQSQGSSERTFSESQYYIEAIGNRMTSLSYDDPNGYYHNFTNWYPNSGTVVQDDFGGAKNVRLMKTSWNNSDSFFNSTL